MRTTLILRTMVIGALVMTGCAKDSEESATKATTKTSSDEDGNSETGNGTTSVDPTNSTPMTTPTTAPTSDGPNTSDGESGSSGGFIVKPDGGGHINECDIWKQDCPEGKKCMPYADDGGGSWNATKCSDVAGNAGQVGDECLAEGGGVSGDDNCDKGTMCWFLDAENKGTCVEMCQGTPDAPTCSGDKICDESNEGVIIVCLDTCDPLAQSCPEGQICFFDGVDTFICDFDASGDEGQYGDPCAFINVCDYGLFCANPETVPDCPPENGCCTPYCNIMDPNTCPGAPMQECVPWYGEGQPTPPGQENIGACAVPV